jgi:hypothetical protein
MILRFLDVLSFHSFAMIIDRILSVFFSLLERSNLDLIYLTWLWSLFKPLCILLLSLFLIPAIILVFMYASSLFCLIYKHWNRLKVGEEISKK